MPSPVATMIWVIVPPGVIRKALSLSRPLERDRGVDETGGQIAVFGRVGSRPLNMEEMQRLYLDKDGKPWYVEN